MTDNQPNHAATSSSSIPHWMSWHTWGLLLIVAAIVSSGLLIPSHSRLWAWLATLALLIAFATIAGQGITGCWSGLLIDERNMMSLSRLQMFLWTALVLSAFLTAALSNIASKQTDPLAIAVPVELWALLGISTTSLVATPLVLNSKKTAALSEAEATQQKSDLAQIASQRKQTGKAGCDVVSHQGKLVRYSRPEYAHFSDMFKGDEVATGAHLDLSKVQMFYFTLILVLAYAVALGTMFAASSGSITTFPAVDASMVALLGISHAGHLVRQAT